MKDQNAVDNAKSMMALATEALAEALSKTQNEIERLERENSRPSHNLRAGLTRLHPAIGYFKWHRLELRRVKKKERVRRKEHYDHATVVLLGIPATALEAEGLIQRDRLRFSVDEEERPGEPMIISDDPEDQLTDDQYNELIQEFNETVEETNERREVVRRLEDQYVNDPVEFLANIPGGSQEEFDRHDITYKMLAAQRLVQAEESTKRIRYQVRKTGRVDWLPQLWDFHWNAADEKHQRPRTAEQLVEKARRVPNIDRRVEEWMDALPTLRGAVVNTDSSPQALRLDRRWHGRPIKFQDPGRYTVPSLSCFDHSELKDALLRKYKTACADLRHWFRHSHGAVYSNK